MKVWLTFCAGLSIIFFYTTGADARYHRNHNQSYQVDIHTGSNYQIEGSRQRRASGKRHSKRYAKRYHKRYAQRSHKARYAKRNRSRTPVQTVADAPDFVRGSLICAINVNAWLKSRGIEGTGSAWAKSFLKWGREAGAPVPGAVAVYNRGRKGGHVAIVAKVDGDKVWVYNPSASRQSWVKTVYHKQAIAYRLPS